jgi:acetyl esterase/lipase
VALGAATYYDAPFGGTGAALDATSGRPDFVALLYPVVTMRPPHAHAASRANLLGAAPVDALVDRWSLERQVRGGMPPVFVVHTAEDRSVPVEQSVALVAALHRAGVPVEAHFYERGAHGFGMAAGLGTTSEWPARWIDWMHHHGWL